MLRSILKQLFKWVSGPLTKMGNTYIEGRNNAELARIEREAKRDFINVELRKAALNDDYRRGELAAAALRRDRGDSRTSWIRPVTAALALLFWFALTLSQIRWIGYASSNQILPVVWDIPPGALGNIFTAFPMGVLASFYIARPIEKFLIGKTRV